MIHSGRGERRSKKESHDEHIASGSGGGGGTEGLLHILGRGQDQELWTSPHGLSSNASGRVFPGLHVLYCVQTDNHDPVISG